MQSSDPEFGRGAHCESAHDICEDPALEPGEINENDLGCPNGISGGLEDMSHKRTFVALSALALAATVVNAGPTGPVQRTQQETTGMSGSPFSGLATHVRILSTDFEPPIWDLDASICGDEFVATCPPPNGLGFANVCVHKNHAASLNCCPDDPNEETGWSMSPSSQHCNEPSIRNVHPYGGSAQHVRFQYDAGGGNPDGCNGFGSACRTRFITSQSAVPQLSKTEWEYQIAFDGPGGSSAINVYGEDTGTGSISLTAYVYWFYLGSLYTYDFTNSTFVFGGYWADDSPDYAKHRIVLNPCNDTVTYEYAGVEYLSENYFLNALGLLARGALPGDADTSDTAFFTTDHYPGLIDMDDHFVTHTACQSCCDGTTGVCSDGTDEADCQGDQQVWTDHFLCDQYGSGIGYCSGQVPSNHPLATTTPVAAKCTTDADCVAPAVGPCILPPAAACIRHSGACCDRTPVIDADSDGVCTDGTYPDPGDCFGDQMTWFKSTPCSQAGPCLEDLGSCCNTLAGTCSTTDIGDCQGAQRVWRKGVLCADAGCSAVLGACCDGDTFGSCESTTSAGCDCQKCVWSKLQTCAQVTCLHEAIPTVSEWGLVVMTLLLLTGAKVYFGRRQTATA
jgi:hypothetical protein